MPPRALVPALLIPGFVAGLTGGTLLADRAGGRRKTAVLVMGVLNNAFCRDGEVAIGLTCMTGRSSASPRASPTPPGTERPGWIAHLVLWLSLAAGTVLGALAAFRAPHLSAAISAPRRRRCSPPDEAR